MHLCEQVQSLVVAFLEDSAAIRKAVGSCEAGTGMFAPADHTVQVQKGSEAWGSCPRPQSELVAEQGCEARPLGTHAVYYLLSWTAFRVMW